MQNVFTFSSGEDMLATIQAGTDLYNLDSGEYLFAYNASGSIASYSIPIDQAKELANKAKTTGEYWGGLLGPGGVIYDDPSYGGFCPNLESNLEYCERKFGEG